MAPQLATCTKEEQRSVIRFLSNERVKSIEIHRQMKVQCGDACLSVHQVYEWTRKSMDIISSVTDSSVSSMLFSAPITFPKVEVRSSDLYP